MAFDALSEISQRPGGSQSILCFPTNQIWQFEDYLLYNKIDILPTDKMLVFVWILILFAHIFNQES
jgi:hypothetical protein